LLKCPHEGAILFKQLPRTAAHGWSDDIEEVIQVDIDAKDCSVEGGGRPRRRHRAWRVWSLAAMLPAIGLMAAGCGGSSGSSTPTLSGGGGSQAATGANKLERFALCMRAHGEPNFPDPTAQGTFPLAAGMSTSAPQFRSAQQACKAFAPPGPLTGQGLSPTQLTKTLKFVSCMRSHGVRSFPDPNAQGRFQGGGSLPVNSPQFFSAYKTCRALLPPGSGFGGGG
jgi:hypothetical protein